MPNQVPNRSAAAPWEARLQKLRQTGPRPVPTHVILEGIGHALESAPRFTIGISDTNANLVLPEAFSAADDCSIPLIREGGRLWFVDTTAARDAGHAAGQPVRTAVEAGDQLRIQCGTATADVLFAYCRGANGARSHD